MKSSRQLAAIMFTDIAGYTALMQRDEQEAIQIRARHRSVFNQCTSARGGRILQYYGDGTLSIFTSVVDAVKCGIDMQEQFLMDPIVPVRIGIHLGDILVTDEEVIGDAVNIAARIESMAEVGSVLVSERVHHDIKNQPDIQTRSLGKHFLKNVETPVEIFAVSNYGLTVPEIKNDYVEETDDSLSNLPNPPTPFFGRKNDLALIKQQIHKYRLVSLIGPGGSGKTRLAIEVARQLRSEFREGVYFVGLASIFNDGMIAYTLAEILRIKSDRQESIADIIANRIGKKEMLIVMDNCEHLIDECAHLVHSLINKTEYVRFLTTSRETLHLAGEATYRVPTFPVPLITDQLNNIEKVPSIQLFINRVRMQKPTFELNQNNSSAIVSICQRLDGLPLAIELAASRINMMDVNGILDRLSNQFKILAGGSRTAPPHQQTLQATLDWSYDLLMEKEKILFCRLSIFPDKFDLTDAEDICSYDVLNTEEIFDLLSNLVDKSLVDTAEYQANVFYHLLEPMRQYGDEKIISASDRDPLEQSFCDHYLKTLAIGHSQRMQRSLQWFNWLTAEFSNLQKAFKLLESIPEQQLKLASYLTEPFFLQENFTIGHELLTLALENCPERNEDRVRVLFGLGFISYMVQSDKGSKLMLEGLEIVRELDDNQLRIDVYWIYGFNQILFREWEEAEAYLTEGLNLAIEYKDQFMVVRYQNYLGWSAVHQGKADQIEAQLIKNLEEAIRLGNIYDITDAQHLIAEAAFSKGEYHRSERLFAQALKSAMEQKSELTTNIFLFMISFSLCGQHRHEKGLLLYAASQERFRQMGMELKAIEYLEEITERTVLVSEKIIGKPRVEELYKQGRNMGFTAAIKYAFDLDRD